MALFGNKDNAEIAGLQQQLAAAHGMIGELRGWVGQLRGAETAALEAELRGLRTAVTEAKREYADLATARQQAHDEALRWRARLVETRELALLQEVGVYEYAHPLDDAVAYKDAIGELKQRIKAAARGDAVTCQVDWAVNGSVKEGQRLGRDMAKLMLRAYNAEADNAVRVVKPHTRESVLKRLSTTRETIGKLGVLMRIAISADYHRLRLKEIELTSDYLARVEVEREQARAERERLREEAKVMKDIERERARLAKERSHYASVVARLEAKGDLDGLARAREQLASVDDAIAGVEQRAANVRTGYVYVISNVGAFGPDVVKIGLTRRLDPMDRVRELGDASVPFRFDVHALFFAEDAVALETELHQRLSHRRVNLVNPRREFFYATPAEVRDLLTAMGDKHILEYTDTAEAVEWRASDPARRQASGPARTDVGADGDLSSDGGE
ncbi:DUF4041 domain-containing protein [Crossiella cryophila]|uniref:Bacteriophage T5 Orf172 DNA-binding domain-containing protein n=1 Tax=Crossiella cryophila TaxID=43355 RepID=A0A7W7CBP4_9PSEU|nr:DUF4041 domain-containing protein [Crossiella cryophila]MBB4678135.1 hypothetical protein [Crossiella cryophila]